MLKYGQNHMLLLKILMNLILSAVNKVLYLELCDSWIIHHLSKVSNQSKWMEKTFRSKQNSRSSSTDWLPHDLLIGKLEAYGFDTKTLNISKSYLNQRQ